MADDKTYTGPNAAAVNARIEQAARVGALIPLLDNDDMYAAWDAARDAAWDAARDPAAAAANDAAWYAARDAARDAARAATRDAAWYAARDAARDAAWYAARAAAWAATRDAARAAAWAACADVVADLLTPEHHAALIAPWQVWVRAVGGGAS